MQKGYLLHRGNAIYGLILLNHKQQAHFELALRGNAVQAVFVKAETFACVQLVILTLIVNDCFAFQCGQDGVAGGAVWGQAGARIDINDGNWGLACMHEDSLFRVLAPKMNIAHFPIEEIGSNAVRILLNQIRQSNDPEAGEYVPESKVLPCRMEFRDQ